MNPEPSKFAKRHNWTRKEIAVLGKMTDAAATLDLVQSAARLKRISLSIPPFGRRES